VDHHLVALGRGARIDAVMEAVSASSASASACCWAIVGGSASASFQRAR